MPVYTMRTTCPATCVGWCTAQTQLPPQKMHYALVLLATIVMLFLVFALGLLLARALRRYRERLLRRRAVPTEYVDAWSMHKLPEDLEPRDPEEPT